MPCSSAVKVASANVRSRRFSLAMRSPQPSAESKARALSQAPLRDLLSRRRRADRFRPGPPRPSQHRVEPRLRAGVRSAAKQGDQQARAVPRDSAAGLNAPPSLPPHQPRVTIRPSLTFQRQQPEAFVPAAAAVSPPFFGAEFAVTAAHAPPSRRRPSRRAKLHVSV